MSFQQGVSGLGASSQNLDVIGNNIANASTIGAKSSRAEFADIYSLASGATLGAGLGVKLGAVAQQFSQGTINTTSNPLDLAINGAGFFQLKDANGMTEYTRNGEFQVSNDGHVVNAEGQQLLAIPVNVQAGQIAGSSQPLQLPTAGIAPQATSTMNLQINLDSRENATFTNATPPINYSDATTFNNSTSLNVFDAKGQSVALTYYFQKTNTDTWNVYATANGVSLGGDNTNPTPITQMSFAPDGSAPLSPSAPISVDVPATGTAPAATTEAIAGVTLDLSKLTQYGAGFAPTAMTQNGFAPGQLTGVSIDPTGAVIGSYSSGRSLPIAQLQLATFRNPQGLKPMGGNTWTQTEQSGNPLIGSPGSGSLGVLQSSSLEQSNVDLTGELVNMMIAQRVYQANAQTVKSEDAVMQTLVNLR